MTTKELLTRKNKIIREVLGIDFDLVPEDQMVEMPPLPLSAKTDIKACIYCLYFYKDNCRKCPMALAGNNCFDEGSTYKRLYKQSGCYEVSIVHHPTIKAKLADLFREYNLSNRLPDIETR